MTRRRKLVLIAIVAAIVLLSPLVAIVTATFMVRIAAHGKTYNTVGSIELRRVGLVLGCCKHLMCGRENLFFKYRVRAAAELFRAGKVEYLIVSGDNSVAHYDEATDMKNSIVERGVPPERIYCDFAGRRTLDSVVRAKEIFGQTNLTVISQKFHNQRAIFIARSKGIDAIGFNARAVDMRAGVRAKCREQLARVKTVLDVYFLGTGPRFLGEKIPIGPVPQSESSRR